MKIQIIGGKAYLTKEVCNGGTTWRTYVKSKTVLGDANSFFVFKSLLTIPSNVLPLHLKKTFPAIIWIFTEGKDDGIESRLPFKIFSTLYIVDVG